MAVVVEISPLDPTSGGRKPLRFAGGDDARLTALNDLTWWPGVIASPVLRMDGWDGDFTGAAQPASGTVQIDPVALRKLDPASPAYRWAGAPLKVWQGAAGADWSGWNLLFAGLVQDYGTDDAGRYSFSAQVDSEPFEAEVLNLRYAGTGGAEGDQNLKDKPKPALFGRARNVEPLLIDATNQVYQVHGYGPIQAVTAVYERAASLALNGGTNVGDFASFAALVAANLPEGSYATCRAQGMFRLGAPAAGLITADIDGDASGGTFRRKTGELIARLCALAGVPADRYALANLAVLDVAVPYTINLYLTAATKLLPLVQAMAQACNAQAIISWSGQLRIVRFGAIPAEAVTLDAKGRRRPPVLVNQEAKVSPPYWRIEMRGARCWRRHTNDEIATYAPLIEVGTYNAVTIYREGNIVSLPDGSRWLYVATTPAAGQAPVLGSSYWSRLNGPTNAQFVGGMPASDLLSQAASGAGAAQTAADAQNAANQAITRINGLADDGLLTGIEKKQLITDDTTLENAWALLDARAAIVGAPVATARSTAASARTAWRVYRDSLSPAWNNTALDTAVNRVTFRGKLTDFGYAIDALADALRAVAAADATAALTRVNRLASDGWLTAGKEKLEARVEFQAVVDRLAALVARHDALGQPSDSIDERTAAGAAIYAGQPNSLGTYLGTLDLTGNTDTAVNPTVWEARWGGAYLALAAFEAAMIGGAEVDIQEVIDAIDATITDGEWTRREKIEVLIPRDAELEALFGLLDGKAATITGSTIVTSARNEASAARSSWLDYRDSLSPAWNDTAEPTTINRVTARARLSAYAYRLDALAEALRAYVDVRATTALDRVAVYDNDGILQKGEKWRLVIEWQALNDDFNAVNVRYAALGYPDDITPFYTAANAEISALGSYLGSFSQGGTYTNWDNAGGDTPFPGGQPTNRPKWLAALKAQAEYRAAVTGRQGPKGDPGTPTRGQETLPIVGLVTAGFSSSGITVPMAISESIPVLFELGGDSPDTGGANAVPYVQVFRASDSAFVANIGPGSGSFSYGTQVDPGSGFASVQGSFTNNTGVAQSFVFRAHLAAGTGQIRAAAGISFLRV